MTLPNAPTTLTHASGLTLQVDRSRLLIINVDFVQLIAKQTSFLWRLIGPILRFLLTRIKLRRLTKSSVELFNMLESALQTMGLEMEVTSTDRPSQKINNTNWQMWVRTTNGAPFTESMAAMLYELLGSTVNWTNALFSPVYSFANAHNSSGRFAPLPHLLMVKAPSDKKLALKKSLATYNLVEAPISKYFPAGHFCFVLDNPKNQNVYSLLPIVKQQLSSIVEEIWFDFVPAEVPTAGSYGPTDPLFKEQWNIERIQALNGWNVSNPPTIGDGVVVAVIDYGCDLTHPDFLATVSAPSGYYSSGAFFSYGINSGNGSYSDDHEHGTNCAGIIAARHNGLGIAGLAGRCQVLPIRITWEPSALIAAIGYAVENNARVISMSLDTSPGYDVPTLKERIRVAFDNENVILCAAAGNSDQGQLMHPAAHSRVIACGATNDDDERVRKDPRREIYWGSDYNSDPNPSNDPLSGGILSVMAPGINIRTTTNQGKGNWPIDPNYTVDFAGTSAAAPHVAALAALIINKNPALTTQQVRTIIETTADQVPKIGYYTVNRSYTNHRWSAEMGYGRINVDKAIKAAGPPYP